MASLSINTKKQKKVHHLSAEMTEDDIMEQSAEAEEEEELLVSFDEMGLDSKILHAIASFGWSRPTLIQEKTIPLALEGHDVLARARTGTGKTGAFSIPIVQKLLEAKKYDSSSKLRALILAPTKELCSQMHAHFRTLTSYCSREVSTVDLSQGSVEDKRAILVSEKPDIVISTPKKVIEYLNGNLLSSIEKDLNYLVIDESDLMFSFGYEQDLMKVLQHLPKSGVQSFLMSATLNTDVKELKKLVLHKPVILKLEEPDLPESGKLLQYHIEVQDDEEKFVLVNALFKLGLIVGKTIVFVSSVDRCYQLKLFLEQFAIRTCVLNSELPIASRCFVVEQFNSNQYDIIIASDERCVIDPATREKKKTAKKGNSQYGVSRGIDFKFVSNIINFDFPPTVDSYVHRVGRTARGNEEAEGNVLSFVSPRETKYFQKVSKKFADKGNFRPYQFKMDELEAFKYRARDALRAVTSIAIKEARIKEIKREMLASTALKGFFKQHPKDHKILKFDRPLHTVKHKAHLADVPEYIVPQTLQTVVKSKRENKRIEEAASLSYEPKKRRKSKPIRARSKARQESDPLKTFRMNSIKRYKDKKRARRRKK